MKTHDLKVQPQYFEAIKDKRKPFEIRRNDRDYQVGDILLLHEWETGPDPRCEVHKYLMGDGKCSCNTEGKYTGRLIDAKVTYMTDYAQQKGYVVMTIEELDDSPTDDLATLHAALRSAYEALELAQEWLSNSMPMIEPSEACPLPLPVIAKALKTLQPHVKP